MTVFKCETCNGTDEVYCSESNDYIKCETCKGSGFVDVNVFKLIRNLSDSMGIDRSECIDGIRSNDIEIMEYSEAESRCKEYIIDSLWAFNAEFLSYYMADGMDAELIRTIQESKCESCNESFKALVGGNIDALVRDAIASDGIGHFLNSYDGNLYELTTDIVAIRN